MRFHTKNVAVIVLSLGFAYVCGAQTPPAPPTSNYSVIKKFVTLSLRNGLETLNDALIYPNPASDVIYISLPASINGDCNVELFNELGSAVFHQVIQYDSQSRFWIPVDELPNGIYIVKIFDGRHVFTKKIELKK